MNNLPHFARRRRRGFTLLEMLVSIALLGMLMIGLNTFMFSMGELWGQNSDARLFNRHVRAVTRHLQKTLQSAVLPPAAIPTGSPLVAAELRLPNGSSDRLLTFELPEGNRLLQWPTKTGLPDVICSLGLLDNEGLVLYWHSRHESDFEDDPPRVCLVTPFVKALTYEYYNPTFKSWESLNKLETPMAGRPERLPSRIRLKFVYGTFTEETTITIPAVVEGMPLP